MLRKFNIGPRLVVLIAIQTVILIVVGATAIFGLDTAARSTEVLNENVSEGTRLDYVSDTLRSDLLGTVYALNSGVVTWQEGRDRLAFARQRFESDWSQFVTGAAQDEAEFIRDVMQPGVDGVRDAFSQLEALFQPCVRGRFPSPLARLRAPRW